MTAFEIMETILNNDICISDSASDEIIYITNAEKITITCSSEHNPFFDKKVKYMYINDDIINIIVK